MLKYLRLVLLAIPCFLYNYFCFIPRYARHPERTPIEKRYKRIRKMAIYVCKICRSDWMIKGEEHLKEAEKGGRRFLLVANHISDLDAISMVAECDEPISFVAKKETAKFPFVGKAIRAIDGVFLDRKDLRQNVKAMQLVEERIKNGHCSYMIFPEGTRNRLPEGVLPPFHAGSFKIPYKTNCPILPLSLCGTSKSFQPDINYKRYPIQMTYFKAVLPSDFANLNTVELSTSIHDLIAGEHYHQKAIESSYFLKGNEKVPLKKGPLSLD